jgi:CRP-like cAMP-binding protein
MKFLEMIRDWENAEDYDSQTVIFSENDPAEQLYVIVSGEVELTKKGGLLGTEGEGGIIGEMAVLDSATNSTTATTLKSTRLAQFDREQFTKLINKNTEFSLHVMAVLAQRLRAVDKFIAERIE